MCVRFSIKTNLLWGKTWVFKIGVRFECVLILLIHVFVLVEKSLHRRKIKFEELKGSRHVRVNPKHFIRIIFSGAMRDPYLSISGAFVLWFYWSWSIFVDNASFPFEASDWCGIDWILHWMRYAQRHWLDWEAGGFCITYKTCRCSLLFIYDDVPTSSCRWSLFQTWRVNLIYALVKLTPILSCFIILYTHSHILQAHSHILHLRFHILYTSLFFMNI